MGCLAWKNWKTALEVKGVSSGGGGFPNPILATNSAHERMWYLRIFQIRSFASSVGFVCTYCITTVSNVLVTAPHS